MSDLAGFVLGGAIFWHINAYRIYSRLYWRPGFMASFKTDRLYRLKEGNWVIDESAE